MQNPSWRFCVVFGDMAPPHEQDVLHQSMQLPMECTCVSSDKLTGTRTLPKSGKWVFPGTRPAFSYHDEPWPGTLLGEITECNFTNTSPTQQGAGPITVFTAGWPQQMMMLGKWGLPERAPKKTPNKTNKKHHKKTLTITKQNWFGYSLSPVALFLLHPSTFLTLPWETTPLQARALLPCLQRRPVQPHRDSSQHSWTHRHTKRNTSTLLSSSLMQRVCQLPFPSPSQSKGGL